MSTRSVIVVTGRGTYAQDGSHTIRLYKHWDGYPTGNLPVIAGAISRAQEQVKEYNENFPVLKGMLGVDQVTGLIIGESTSLSGIGAHIDDDDDDESGHTKKAYYDSAFNPKHLGSQGDLEWLYVVNIDTKNIDVYEDSFEMTPQESLEKGTADPLMEIEGMREECKDGARAEILEIKKSIFDLGWTINGSKDVKPKERKIVYR